MRHSSDSIAQLAGALAKAQLELVNPVKTHLAVLDTNGSGGKCYRYAPLAAGLEIVRKVLGRHEIAIIQATEVDAEGGMVLLATTLAHSSGEWIAARWPMCRIVDMSNLQLMGAALTYARRYGLFALARIAGEDDLDAAGFARPGAACEDAEQPRTALNEFELGETGVDSEPKGNGQPPASEPGLPGPAEEGASRPKRGVKALSKAQEQRRAPETSANDLLRSLERTRDSDALLQWALESLPARNGLEAGQRALLDDAFLARAGAIGSDPDLLLAFHLNANAGPELASAPA